LQTKVKFEWKQRKRLNIQSSYQFVENFSNEKLLIDDVNVPIFVDNVIYFFAKKVKFEWKQRKRLNRTRQKAKEKY
jgi:hypothetical protein